MDETTWAASTDELPELLRLAREGRDAIENVRGGELWLERDAPAEPIAETFSAAIASPDALLLLCGIDGVPVGFLFVLIEVANDRSLAVSKELYVMPEAREVGLGELMMNQAIEWATERGAIGMDGYALPGDRATKNFFETFGLVARGIVVHRPFIAL